MLHAELNASPDAARAALGFLKWAKLRPEIQTSYEYQSNTFHCKLTITIRQVSIIQPKNSPASVLPKPSCHLWMLLPDRVCQGGSTTLETFLRAMLMLGRSSSLREIDHTGPS